MAVALLVAAGRGERLGYALPKALVPLAGRPMLEWSLETLRALRAVDEVVVALPADSLDGAPPGTRVVAGGSVRSASVRAALEAGPVLDPVIVHDAARPLATAELFERALEQLDASRADAVIAATPVSDTIKQVADDGAAVEATLPRARLWAVQTPQVFRREALVRALDVEEDVLAAATDDAWLVERRGGTVQVSLGSPQNLKVTTALDLRVAELLLAERSAR